MIVESILAAGMSIIPHILLGAAIGMAVRGVVRLISLWGQRHTQLPQSVQSELSETDREMVATSREVIKESFGDNVVETMRNASCLDRVKMFDKFANDLAKAYGLDVVVDIIDDENLCGFYNFKENRLAFNVNKVMMDSNDPYFEAKLLDAIDTIVHELRHAVQYKAAEDPTFWNVGEERANTWRNNLCNYISPSVDVRAYAQQPVEADAATFAAEVLREVK